MKLEIVILSIIWQISHYNPLNIRTLSIYKFEMAEEENFS